MKLTISSLFLGGLAPRVFGLNSEFFTEKDKYGGWKKKSFKATGFFRVEKDDRWWLVTPEGNAFLSFGVNHFHTGWWKAPYNREAWMKLMQINRMEDFNPALRSWLIKTCKEYGFNTAGVHTDLNVLNTPQPQIPYVKHIRFVDISHWKSTVGDENFLDIFSEDFYAHCDKIAKEMAAPLKNDPYLLGYAMTDCPLFTEEDCRERTDNIYGGRRASRIGWPRRLRNLEATSAGKKAYVKIMTQIYEADIQKFNDTYGTTFESFSDLEKAEEWRTQTDLSNINETRDNLIFLKACVEKYYQTTKDAIFRYDANHLFLGDKMNGNTDALDTLLPVISKYTDVIFYQMYGKYETQKPGLDRWANRTDKPIINGDSAFTYIKENMPRPFGPIADTETQCAEWVVEFFQKAFARPEFVGWHYCGLIDTPVKLVKKESERQHSGLFSGYGEPYEELKKAVIRCSDELYKVGNNEKE